MFFRFLVSFEKNWIINKARSGVALNISNENCFATVAWFLDHATFLATNKFPYFCFMKHRELKEGKGDSSNNSDIGYEFDYETHEIKSNTKENENEVNQEKQTEVSEDNKSK